MNNNLYFQQSIKEPLDRYLAGSITEKEYEWWKWRSSVRYLREKGFPVHEGLMPYYHRLLMADKVFFRNGSKDTTVKNALIEAIEQDGRNIGSYFNKLDIVKAAENWAERLMPDNHDPSYFFWLMEVILPRSYKPDWNKVYNELKKKLGTASNFGNFKTHELYCLLMGITMIERTPLSREKKDELIGLMRWNWQFIKYMYSVLIHYIVGFRLENFAALANTVCNKSYFPYMHWFYKAFNENFDKICPEGVFDLHSGRSVRDQALVHMKKMEEIIKSTKPSTELDELFGIIFPKVIEDLNKQKRPKTYEELEKAVDDLTNRYNMVLEQLTNAVKDVESDKISTEDLTAAFLRFPTDLALGLFGSVSTLLAHNQTWLKCASHIREQILAKHEKPIIHVQGDYVVEKKVENEVKYVSAGGTGICTNKTGNEKI